jgi:hypothetical protein
VKTPLYRLGDPRLELLLVAFRLIGDNAPKRGTSTVSRSSRVHNELSGGSDEVCAAARAPCVRRFKPPNRGAP